MKGLVLSLGAAVGLLVSGGVASAHPPASYHHGHGHHGHHGHYHGGWSRPYYPPTYSPWGYRSAYPSYRPGWSYLQPYPYRSYNPGLSFGFNFWR
jgi:hypothetical protein